MIWPADLVPRVHQGAVEIHGSRVIAQVGDEVTGGGEYSDRASGERSRPVVLRASNIKTLPHVEVYRPKQDGTLANNNPGSKAPARWECNSALGRSGMKGDTGIDSYEINVKTR